MTKVLVTGGNGQLGSCIKEIVRRKKRPNYQFIFVDIDELDLTNTNLIESYFFTNQFDFCINCAAYTAVDLAESQAEKAFKINADAVATLAKECKKQGTKFIHISTDYVFDGNSETPYKETDQVNPQSVYGKSKLEGERKVFDINDKAIIIRTAWVYSHYGKNFVKTMVRLMEEKEEISVVNDQIGAPTNAADLASAILHIFMNYPQATGTYHYSNQGKISWYDFAVAIAEIKGFKTKIQPIPSKNYPTPAKRPAFSLLDTSKIQQKFNLHIPEWKVSLAEHLKKI